MSNVSFPAPMTCGRQPKQTFELFGDRRISRYDARERSDISKNRIRGSLVRRPSGKRATTFARQADPMRRRELVLLLGGVMMTARILRAQQKAMPVIGFLSSASPGPNAALLAAFRQGLSDTGFVEGKNAAIEYRWAEGHYDRLPALAADLVGRK